MTLRPAGADDYADIYRLCESTMRRYVEADLGDCFDRIAGPALRQLLQRGCFFRIHTDDGPAGAVAFEEHATHLQLEELYVEPDRQRCGLGTAVMRQLIDRSETLARPIRLHVLASNPARAFYQRLGFTIVRSVPAVVYLAYTPAQPGQWGKGADA